jgi:four helix bundle protein
MYKDLEIWKDSLELIKLIYPLSEQLPKNEEYNLKSQLKRTITSVALNIAEGKGRQTAKDFSHFLNLASASLDETDAILTICEELNILTLQEEIHNKNRILCRRINALRNKLAEDKI